MSAKSLSQLQNLSPIFWLKQWLESVEVDNAERAHFIDDHIPSACPFARDVILFGHKWFSIPPMCKLNPTYEQLMMLKFKAQCYLADHPDADHSDQLCHG